MLVRRGSTIALDRIEERYREQHGDGAATDGEGGEHFLFSDFKITIDDAPPPRAKKSKQTTLTEATAKQFRQEEEMDDRIVRRSLKGKFEFGDFAVLADDTDIPATALLTAYLRKDEDASERFDYGDFAVGVTEELQSKTAERDAKFRAQLAAMGRGTGPIPPSSHGRRGPGQGVAPLASLAGVLRSYEVSTMLGHATRVKCIALSTNEQLYVSSSSKDTAITMSDFRTGKPLIVFEGHEDAIISARFSDDAKFLATTSRDRTLIVWDTVVGKQLFILEHAKIVICCAFSSDSRFIVSGCQDKVCRVWSTKKGKELSAFTGHEGIITAVAFATDLVVSASSDKTLMLWNALSAARIATLHQHAGIILSCSFSAQGRLVVSSDERLVHVWDISDHTAPFTKFEFTVDSLPSLPAGVAGGGGGGGGDEAAAKKRTWTVSGFCPEKFPNYVLAACSDKCVYVLDPRDGTIVVSFDAKATVFCLSSASTHIMMGDAYGNIYVVQLG